MAIYLSDTYKSALKMFAKIFLFALALSSFSVQAQEYGFIRSAVCRQLYAHDNDFGVGAGSGTEGRQYWAVVRNGNALSFRSWLGFYLSVQPNGSVLASSPTIGANEQFFLVPQPRGGFSLVRNKNGNLLTISADCQSLSTSVNAGDPQLFSLVTTPAPAGRPTGGRTLTLVSGSPQSKTTTDTKNASFQFAPVVVNLRDATGKPVGGAPIIYSCGAVNSGTIKCQVDPGGAPFAMVLTGAGGNATLSRMNGASAVTYFGVGRVNITIMAEAAAPLATDFQVSFPPFIPGPIGW
jgi:hypothetical protein